MSEQPSASDQDQQADENERAEAEKPKPAAAKIVFADPFDRQSSDDTDAAWGESSGARGLDWYQSQRPPHHGG
jgi:hypothetical protein